MPFLSNLNFAKPRRGFSLIEFVIVVAIGGIIVGGIWTVAYNVMENVRRNQTKDAIHRVVNHMRSYYAARDGMPRRGSQEISSLLITQGIIPKEFVRRGAPCTNPGLQCADTPWGLDAADLISNALAIGSFRVCDWSLTAGQTGCVDAPQAGDPVPHFGIVLTSLSFANCLWLATNLTTAGGPSGLVAVRIQGAAATSSFPLSVAEARVSCGTNPAAKAIRFVYRLRAPQQ